MRYLVGTLFCFVVILLASCASNEMSIEQFAKIKPFKGKVASVEKITYERNYPLRSISGPDYRVTVVRPDGSIMIIRRIHTTIPSNAPRLEGLPDKRECTLPDEILECEDKPERRSPENQT